MPNHNDFQTGSGSGIIFQSFFLSFILKNYYPVGQMLILSDKVTEKRVPSSDILKFSSVDVRCPALILSLVQFPAKGVKY